MNLEVLYYLYDFVNLVLLNEFNIYGVFHN